jgi:hypothetical protein
MTQCAGDHRSDHDATLLRSFRGVNAVEVTHHAAYFTSRQSSFPVHRCNAGALCDATRPLSSQRVAWNLLIESVSRRRGERSCQDIAREAVTKRRNATNRAVPPGRMKMHAASGTPGPSARADPTEARPADACCLRTSTGRKRSITEASTGLPRAAPGPAARACTVAS